MGGLIDKAGIQFQVLNRSKGPAVWVSRLDSLVFCVLYWVCSDVGMDGHFLV